MTHRQFLAWGYWLKEQWEHPSRTDYYLMQVAFEVLRGNLSKPAVLKLSDMKLKFKHGKKPMSEEHKKNLTDLAKAQWLGWVGLKEKKNG